MKNLALFAAAGLTAIAFSGFALADEMTSDFTKVDANNDGVITFEEAQGAYPTLTQDLFNQADANADGSLDDSEYTSLQGLAAVLDDGTTDASSSAM